MQEQQSPLDFRVLEQPITTLNHAGNTIPTDRFKALVRDDDGSVLSIVNKTYKVVQFPDLMEHTDKQIRDVFPDAKFDVNQQSSFGGRIGFVEYVFPELLAMKNTPNDKAKVQFRIIVSNSFGLGKIKLYAGAIDNFCTNGMIFGEYGAAFWKHTKNLDIQSRFTEQIKRCSDQFIENSEKLSKWMQKPVRREQVDAFFSVLPIGEKLSDKLKSRYLEYERHQRGDTLWSIYSALTFYASHESDIFPIRKTKQDHANFTLMRRQQSVADWIRLPEWEAMAA